MGVLVHRLELCCEASRRSCRLAALVIARLRARRPRRDAPVFFVVAGLSFAGIVGFSNYWPVCDRVPPRKDGRICLTVRSLNCEPGDPPRRFRVCTDGYR
jgi:hypothetical protein